MLPGTRKTQLTQCASVHLDMARGTAALAVLFGHVRALFFVPYHELTHHSIPLAAFYAVTTLGHQAVIVFFVLSGFFIVSSVVVSFEHGRWSWTAYLINRIVRLSLVLIPALILCCIVDRIGMALPSTSALYHRSLENLVATSVANLETFRNFVGSFFYVQSILVQPFGSDGPLWSLSYEFWYYILFPVALCALVSKFRPRARAVYSVLAILVVLFIGRTIALYFLIWLFGGAIAVLSIRGWLQVRLAWMNAAAVVPLVCVLGFSVRWPLDSAFLTDGIVAVGFGLWMYSVVGMPEKPVNAIYARMARLVAGFSYTLYLTHFPIMFFIRARMIHGAVWRPDFIHILFAGWIAMVPIAIAYGIAQVTEAKTTLVRRGIMGLVQ
jgi:peptidoglycan/LPS O-acetylase OafA/YrhL